MYILEDTVTVFGGIRSCVTCPSGTAPDVTSGFNCVGQTVSDVFLYVRITFYGDNCRSMEH